MFTYRFGLSAKVIRPSSFGHRVKCRLMKSPVWLEQISVLDAKTLLIDNYNKHQENIEQATSHFKTIRNLAIKHAEKLKAEIEAYEHQQYRYLLFSFARSQEAAMEAQMEYWFEYAKRIRSTHDRAIARAIYECEKAIYRASGGGNQQAVNHDTHLDKDVELAYHIKAFTLRLRLLANIGREPLY